MSSLFPAFLPSCVQGVVWGGSAVGRVCADHTAGPAEEIRGSRLLLPPAEGERGGQAGC